MNRYTIEAYVSGKEKTVYYVTRDNEFDMFDLTTLSNRAWAFEDDDNDTFKDVTIQIRRDYKFSDELTFEWVALCTALVAEQVESMAKI